MEEIAIIEVNSLLKLVEATRLTDNEITRLTKAGNNPTDLEGYYNTALQALEWRESYHPNARQQIELLKETAFDDEIVIEPEAPVVVDVKIPIFAIGL